MLGLNRQVEDNKAWSFAAAYHAYAPWPIVFDMIRKGSSVGKGANCEWAIMIRDIDR